MSSPAILPAPDDCLFSSAAWGRVLAKAYGMTTGATQLPSGHRLAYASLEGVGGRRVVAPPFSDYLPIADIDDASAALGYLNDVADGAPVTLKTALTRADADAVSGARVSREAVLHVMLPGACASKRFGVNVRRATRDGVTARENKSHGALTAFYALYAALRVRKFGSIPQPLSFFEAVYDSFVAEGRGFFLEAVHGGRVIASLFLLEAGARLYYKFGASSVERLGPRPNHLLFDRLVTWVREGRYAAVDLGLSGAGEAYAGLRSFKSDAGATQAPLHYLQTAPPGYDPSAREAHLAQLDRLTEAMTEAELSTAQLSRLSEAIYPSFA